MYPNLKLQIFKQGIRQNQMARELKFCESQLSKIINGYREPSDDERKLLAHYLNVEEGWLFRDTRTSRPRTPLTSRTCVGKKGNDCG